MKVAQQQSERKQTGLRLDPEVWRAARIRATELGMTAAEFVEAAIREYLRRLASKKPAA
jgi:predicted HicB family RNase H-like nuclease